MAVRFPDRGPNWTANRRQRRLALITRAQHRRQLSAMRGQLGLLTNYREVEQAFRDQLSGSKTIADILRTSRLFMEELGIGGVAIYRYSNDSQNLWAMEREALNGASRYKTPKRLMPGEKHHFIESAQQRAYSAKGFDILLVDRLRMFEEMSPTDRRQAEEDFEYDLRRYFGQDYAKVYATRLSQLRHAVRFNLYVRYPGVRAYDMIIMANNHAENAAKVTKGSIAQPLFPDAKRQEFVFEALRSLQRPITEELHKAEEARLARKNMAMAQAIDELQRSLNATDDLSEMFSIALNSLPGVYMRNGGSYVDRSSIMLADDQGTELRIIDQRGLNQTAAAMTSRVGSGIAGNVFEQSQPLLVEDAATAEIMNDLPRPESVRRGSFMCVPISFKGNKYGVLNVRSSYVKAFTQKDLRHLQRIAGILAYKIREVSLIRELEQAANFDGLTGLPRREYAITRIEEMLALAEAARKPLSFIMLDLDRFKRVNDRYGHKAGDLVLQGTAGIIKRWLEAHKENFVDAVASRWGGEEWVIGALGANEKQAADLVESLRREFEANDYQGPDFWGETLQVTTSIGVAVFPFHGRGLDDLSKNADKALYVAKHQGRNCVTFYDPHRSYSQTKGE